MSLSLGEKLRQAREDRGFTISEVAEQTRISSLYLESIENDNYKILPGGIFNKGFVKSYAKFVGVSEQEALTDYAALLTAAAENNEPDLKKYKPEVLTDDRAGSMVPTVIVAVIILGLMTAGILYLVNYVRSPAEITVANTAANSKSDIPAIDSEKPESANGAPQMASLKVEFKAINAPVPLSAVTDGEKSDVVLTAGSEKTFEPKESLTVNYNKWNFDKLQMTINGKAINLPATPINQKDKRIEFTISKANLSQIWSSGSVSTEVPAVAPIGNNEISDGTAANTTPTTTTSTPASAPAKTPVPKPSANANAVVKPTPEANKPAATPKPTPKLPTMTGKPTNVN